MGQPLTTMRIAVVANNLRVAGGASVGRNIVATLPEVAPMHDYLFVVPRGVGYEQFPGQTNIDLVETSSQSSLEVAIELLHRIPRMLATFAPDLVWSLGNLPIRHPPSRQALLVHNPHLFSPESHFANEIWRYKQKDQLMAAYLTHSLRFVDLVFCQTDTAAGRFRQRYGWTKVAVMPNAVSGLIAGDSATTPSALAPYADRFKILALTKYYAHKNLELILDAYRQYGDGSLAGTVCFLTIDPSQHPRVRNFLRDIARSTPEQIVNLGPLSQATLGSYFHEMDALLQPSTLESFSASYLEAMAFDVPVVASNLDFAREVCGDAAVYFDPFDAADLALAVGSLRDNRELRQHLIAEGRQRLGSTQADWPTVVRSALNNLEVPHLGTG